MKRILIIVALAVASFNSFAQGAIQVVKLGKGRPVLLLPGFATPGSVWDRTIRNLPAECETHSITYAGFGGIPPVATPWYDQVKSELLGYVNRHNLRDVVVIGHSMGGNLALELAVQLQDRITGLILIESIPCMRELIMPGGNASSLKYDSPYNNQVIGMSDDGFTQMATSLAQNMTTDSSKAKLIRDWTTQADRKTYVYGYTDLLKLDLRDSLSKIRLNTLILGAAFPDKELVRTNYEKQYQNLSSKQIIIADNCRHYVMFDQPEWLEAQINKYIKPDGSK